MQQTLKTRLGIRLTALYESIPPETEYLWDLCCDHGSIGRAVLEQNPRPHVTFNDIHPGIMQSLQEKLRSFNATGYDMNVNPAEKVQLPGNKNTCVLLAGVGDQQCINILTSLLAQPESRGAWFIISPATKTFFLREFLVDQNLFLISESLVTENMHTYEIITVSNNPECNGDSISQIDNWKFGTAWQIGDTQHIEHLSKLIRYFKSQLDFKPNPRLVEIVDGYQKKLDFINLTS